MIDHYAFQDQVILDGFMLTGMDSFKTQLLPDYKEFTYIDESILSFISVIPQSEKIAFSGTLFEKLVDDRVFQNKPWDKHSDYLDIMNRPNNLEYIYLIHKDPESAKRWYDEAYANDLIFKSFDNYWIYYINANEFYKSLYKETAINPRVFTRNIDDEFAEIGRLY